MRDTVSNFLFGRSNQYILEQKVVVFGAFAALLAAVFATVDNVVSGMPITHILISGIGIIISAIFLWISRRLKQPGCLPTVMVYSFLVLLSAGWYPLNGSFGVLPFYYIMLCIFAIIVLPAISRNFFLAITTIILLLLFFHEFRHGQFLSDYSDLQTRYIDVAVNLFIVMLFTGFLILMVVRQHRKEKEEKAALLVEVEKSLAEIKQLKNILPICANCKKIRDDAGYWQEVTAYISKHTDTVFTHGICQECIKKLYPELTEEDI